MSRWLSAVLNLVAGLSSGFSASAMPVTMQNTLGRESSLIFGISGLLQLCVAGYAIRLNRLFGVTRVGWSLLVSGLQNRRLLGFAEHPVQWRPRRCALPAVAHAQATEQRRWLHH
jgi:hypothetical protein